MNNSIIVGLFTLIGALIGLTGIYFSQKWTLHREIKIKNYEKKLAVFSEIMGLKILLMQNYVSRFEAYVFSDYFEYRWKKLGSPMESIDFKEAIRHMHKSEDLVLEISKAHQQLFEKLAIIKVLFSQSNEIDSLIEKLYFFKTPVLRRPTESMELNELEEYQQKAVSEVQQFAKKEFGDYIDTLLNLVEKELKQNNH